MHFPWSLVTLVLAYGVGYGTRPLIERAKRDSPDWRARSRARRRFLALLPGYLVGFTIGVVLILLLDR